MLNKIEISRKRLGPPWWGVSPQPVLQVKHSCDQDTSTLKSPLRQATTSLLPKEALIALIFWQNGPARMALVSLTPCFTCHTLMEKWSQNFSHIPCGCSVFGLSWGKLLAGCTCIPQGCTWCLCWLFPWNSKANLCHELGLAYRGDGWSTMLTGLYLLGLWFQYSSALLRDFGTSFNTQEFSIPHFQEALSGKGNFQAVGSALVICNQIFQATSGKRIVDFREWRGNTCIWLLQSIRKMILLARCQGNLP